MRLNAVLGFAGAVAATACNGHTALCDRKFSDVIQVGSHDSAFVGELPTENQYDSIKKQLGLGVRFLQAQTHNLDGTIEMCHTSCLELDAGSLKEYLTPVYDFMEDNPNEIITMLLTNGDAIPVAEFDKVFAEVGLKKYAFSPRGQIAEDDWPTLQKLIDDGTRLLVFMDYHADPSVVSYITNEFDYYWETAYNVTDSSFPSCALNRPPGGSATTLMGLMNHMLHFEVLGIQIPDSFEAGTTNSESSIDSQVDECVSEHGHKPRVILLDFVNVGQAIEAQNHLNGLS